MVLEQRSHPFAHHKELLCPLEVHRLSIAAILRQDFFPEKFSIQASRSILR
jgi:hypothetical protein